MEEGAFGDAGIWRKRLATVEGNGERKTFWDGREFRVFARLCLLGPIAISATIGSGRSGS